MADSIARVHHQKRVVVEAGTMKQDHRLEAVWVMHVSEVVASLENQSWNNVVGL